MGISDDIKPKKVYHFRNTEKPIKAPAVFVEREEPPKEIANQHEQTAADHMYSPINHEEKTKLEEDFFRNKTSYNSSEERVKRLRFPTKAVSWILILLITIFVLKQNFNKIKDLVSPKQEKKVVKSEDDYYVNNKTEENKDNQSVETGTNSEAAATTPADNSSQSAVGAVIDKSNINIKVLNGNGIKGSADSVGDELTKAGFKVSKVANAQKFTYSDTYIYYKSDKEESANLVKNTLSSRTCITEKSDTLTTGYDIVVVVGKN